jgi:antitoxin (DNA-binding transcriptional repressor) of toxin-antitoxin stability system
MVFLTFLNTGVGHMKKLTIRETRQGLAQLEKILSQEGEVTITRRGEAIARVVQIGKQRPIPSHQDLRKKMRPMGKDSAKMIRQDRDGR